MKEKTRNFSRRVETSFGTKADNMTVVLIGDSIFKQVQQKLKVNFVD